MQLTAANTLHRPVLIAGPRAVSWHLTAAVLDTAASVASPEAGHTEVRNYRYPEKCSAHPLQPARTYVNPMREVREALAGRHSEVF